MFLPDSLVPAFCSEDSMRPAKAMRNEGGDSSKCLPVELEDDKHIQSILHTGQHLEEPVRHTSMRILGQGRREAQETCPNDATGYGHPERALM